MHVLSMIAGYFNEKRFLISNDVKKHAIKGNKTKQKMRIKKSNHNKTINHLKIKIKLKKI